MTTLGSLIAGCGSPVDQAVKNEVFTLNSEWSASAARLDNIERKLLEAKTIANRNMKAMRGIGEDGLDSLAQVRTTEFRHQYRQQMETFGKLWSRAQDLEEGYIRAHTDYSEFHVSVEKDQISTEEAREKVEVFRARLQQVRERISAMEGRVVGAVRAHNTLAREIQPYASPQKLSLIDPLELS
jgi:predicted  nucleic acid-binding Zn-ribbon protein